MARREGAARMDRAIVLSFVGLTALATLVYGALWYLDVGAVGGDAPWNLWVGPNTSATIGNFGEVTVAVLGIALTVVAIIVELSAHRYTPRVTELFVRDPVNIVVLSFFVLTSVLVLWVGLSLQDHGAPPRAMVRGAMALMSVSLLLLLPYFFYVFDFLAPTGVVQRIEDRAKRALRKASRLGPEGARRLRRAATLGDALAPLRAEVVQGVEQLGEMVLNSVDKKDKAIAVASLAALASLAERSLLHKASLPDAWFSSEALADEDQDFVALHRVMVRALEARRTWLEMKVLRQYQAAFSEALLRVHDIDHLIAIHTRNLANVASTQSDIHAMRLAMRFINTYLRGTINARDVRGAYNVLNEYRVMAENLVVRGFEPMAVEIAGHLKFYGLLAFHTAQPFVLETAAYDLCALLEHAHVNRASCHDTILEIFLDVDREPEGDRTQEQALRGVRKAQVKLATHYLDRGDLAHAVRIFDDMAEEEPARLASIRAELEAIDEPEFWEVSDRGANFDYLTEARRAQLAVFFDWFETGAPVLPPASAPGPADEPYAAHGADPTQPRSGRRLQGAVTVPGALANAPPRPGDVGRGARQTVTSPALPQAPPPTSAPGAGDDAPR